MAANLCVCVSVCVFKEGCWCCWQDQESSPNFISHWWWRFWHVTKTSSGLGFLLCDIEIMLWVFLTSGSTRERMTATRRMWKWFEDHDLWLGVPEPRPLTALGTQRPLGNTFWSSRDTPSWILKLMGKKYPYIIKNYRLEEICSFHIGCQVNVLKLVL